jgi:hypothetical protein
MTLLAYFEPQPSQRRPADDAMINGVQVLLERYQTPGDQGAVGESRGSTSPRACGAPMSQQGQHMGHIPA